MGACPLGASETPPCITLKLRGFHRLAFMPQCVIQWRDPMALPPLYGGPWLDLLIKDPLTYARHALRGNSADDADFAKCSPDRPPVLLVHGFMGTRGALFLLESRLRAD